MLLLLLFGAVLMLVVLVLLAMRHRTRGACPPHRNVRTLGVSIRWCRDCGELLRTTAEKP